MTTAVALYPVAVALTTTLALALVAWRSFDRVWGRILAGTGVVHSVGYIAISRAMHGADLSILQPSQLLFSVVAIGIATKLVVFAPPFLARAADPELSASFTKGHIALGVAGSWLIQSVLGLIYVFPDSYLRVALVWLLPTTPVFIYASLMVIGILVVQVVMAGRIYEATPKDPSSTSAPAPADPAVPRLSTDGGRDE